MRKVGLSWDYLGALDYHSLPTCSLQRYYTDTISRGLNPSEEEVQDIINEVDQDGSGKVIMVIVNIFASVTNAAKVEWPEFASVLATLIKAGEEEDENYKETFRVFSKEAPEYCFQNCILFFGGIINSIGPSC